MKTLIVDDEPLARKELSYLIKQNPNISSVAEADGVTEARQAVKDNHFDLIFLDIQLTDGSGMAFAEWLKELPTPPHVIFATAYDQYALDAFDADALDYLLKPFSQARVDEAINKVARLTQGERPVKANHQQQANPRLSVTSDDRTFVIQKQSLLYLEANSGSTKLWTEEGKCIDSKQSLTSLQEQLDPHQFMRVHRSFVVNLDMVSELQPAFNHTYELTLKDGSKVPVSRSYVAKAKQALGIY